MHPCAPFRRRVLCVLGFNPCCSCALCARRRWWWVQGLLASMKFHRGLVACCVEVVAACYRMVSCAFPKVGSEPGGWGAG